MNRILLALCIVFVAASWASVAGQSAPAPNPESRIPNPDFGFLAGPSQKALMDQYCVTCHNERLTTGGLALDTLQKAGIEANAETWEKVVRKVRAGLMPPAGAKRPDRGSLDALATSIEGTIDHFAANNPNPGRAPLHRMNRV
ncbi:MAG TPA: c-type cytochrome domain-containing protein, partial [Vicinamibacterales bacterium]